MGDVIEFKKHMEQREDHSSVINSNNILLQRVYDFDCPVPLYSDEDGQLFTVFYNSATEQSLIIPFYDDVESLVEHEKKKGRIMNVTSSEL